MQNHMDLHDSFLEELYTYVTKLHISLVSKGATSNTQVDLIAKVKNLQDAIRALRQVVKIGDAEGPARVLCICDKTSPSEQPTSTTNATGRTSEVRPAEDTWLTKGEAAQHLECSIKTFERIARERSIRKILQRVRGRRARPLFSKEDVYKVKVDLEKAGRSACQCCS